MKKIFTSTVLIILLLSSKSLDAQAPLLESKPGSNYVLYLDFDGALVTGTFWNSIYNSSNPIFAAASSQNNTGITNTWKQVAEDFRPFDINVTTDSTVYNSATAGQRMWVVITPTDTWFGSPAGGVAFLGSFTWTSKTPCWCFENNLAYTAEYIAECISHEGGHTFSLVHQSRYNGSCTKTDEYNPGTGAGFGQIGWAPIMGVGYYTNMTTFYNGFSTSGCATRQNDWGVMLAGNGFGLRADEYGNSRAAATAIPMTGTSYDTSGIIIDSNDVDYLKLSVPSNSTISVTVNPYNIGTSNKKANLDVRLELQDSSGTVLYYSDSATILNAALSNMALTPGNYYIVIDGVGSAYYTDYASVGQYSLSITSTVPLAKNDIVTDKKFENNQWLINWTYPSPETIKNSWFTISDVNGSQVLRQEIKPFKTIQLDPNIYNNHYLKIGIETFTGSAAYSDWITIGNSTPVKVVWDNNINTMVLSGNNLKNTSLEIFNVQGRLLYSGKGAKHQPQIERNQIYFYRLSGANAGQGKIFCN